MSQKMQAAYAVNYLISAIATGTGAAEVFGYIKAGLGWYALLFGAIGATFTALNQYWAWKNRTKPSGP